MHAESVRQGVRANGSAAREPFAEGEGSTSGGEGSGGESGDGCEGDADGDADGGGGEDSTFARESAAGTKAATTATSRPASPVCVMDMQPEEHGAAWHVGAEAAAGDAFLAMQTAYEQRLPPQRRRGDGWVTLQVDNGSNTSVACSVTMDGARR